MDRLYELLKKIITKLSGKVNSEEGKGLSTNDFTNEEQTKLSGIENEAQVNTIESISVNGTSVLPDEAKNVEIKAYNEDNKPEVGGRNYILDSKNKTCNQDKEMADYKLSPDFSYDSIKGKTVTVSIYIKAKNVKPKPEADGRYYRIGMEPQVFYEDGSHDNLSCWLSAYNPTDYDGRLAATYTIKDKSITRFGQLATYCQNLIGDELTASLPKIEFGEIATDWTPAPEDLQTYLPLYKKVADNDPVQFPTNALSLSFMQGTTPDCPTPDNGGMLLTMRLTGASTNNAQLFIPDDASQLNLGAMWMRTIKSNGTYSGWTQIAKISDITTDNFEGVLPIEKGGTGRSDGYSLGVKDQRSDTLIKLLWDGDIDNEEAEDGGALYPIIGITSSKTSGGTGYGAVTNSYFKSKFNIVSKTDYATATTAGLVKPGTGLSITEDGTLSISQEELQSMIDDAVTKAISSRTLQE